MSFAQLKGVRLWCIFFPCLVFWRKANATNFPLILPVMPEQGSSLVARGCAWLMWERLHNMLRLFDLRGLNIYFVIPVSIDCRGPETSLAQNFFSCATYCARFQWWSQTSCACLKNIGSTGRYHRDPAESWSVEVSRAASKDGRLRSEIMPQVVRLFAERLHHDIPICLHLPWNPQEGPKPVQWYLHHPDHDDPMMHSKCTLHERLVICKFATARVTRKMILTSLDTFWHILNNDCALTVVKSFSVTNMVNLVVWLVGARHHKHLL